MNEETLGVVRLTSGVMMVLDFGALYLWSDRTPPLLEPGRIDSVTVDRINNAMDFEVVGAGSDDVVSRLDLASARGSFVFDWPSDQAGHLSALVSATSREMGLSVELRQIDRMPHRTRSMNLADRSLRGCEVPFHGMWAIVVPNMPPDQVLEVKGRRMGPDDDDSDRWSMVWVEVSGRPVATSELLGYALVDEARLMACDLDLLGHWSEGEPLDGLFDVVFWGRDEEVIAERIGAGCVVQGQGTIFGWKDLSIGEMRRRAQALLTLEESGEFRFVVDIRPHDHAYELLSQAWNSESESGQIELGGGVGTGWFTTWGDGAFPVYRDTAIDGELVAIRIDHGSVYGGAG